MTDKITSRFELSATLAASGFFPKVIDMGNGRTVLSTKEFCHADGSIMLADPKLAGRGGSHGAGNWSWVARAA